MFYLILAIISSALVSVVMRISQRFTRNGMTLLASNYVMCTAAAAFLAGSPIPTGEGSGLTILLGCISGVLYLLGFVLLQYNIRRGGVVLPATFQKLGVHPFDQPGVEAYKMNMFALLGKPGYEAIKEALEAKLNA